LRRLRHCCAGRAVDELVSRLEETVPEYIPSLELRQPVAVSY
jgi:hypothetical protein